MLIIALQADRFWQEFAGLFLEVWTLRDLANFAGTFEGSRQVGYKNCPDE